MTEDIAGVGYWDDVWGAADLPTPIDVDDRRVRNYVTRALHAVFTEAFADLDTAGMRLVEVGCAGSKWLPYFNRQFGFEVTGIDYSEAGCALTERILDAEGVSGETIRASMFDPPPHALGRFDVVVTFGLVEHFDDTAAAIGHLGGLLVPGGTMVTVVPNMYGSIGAVQRVLNRPVYDKHVALDPDELAAAHRGAGLEVVSSSWELPSHFGVNNLNGVPPGARRLAATAAWKLLLGVSASAWWLDERGVRLAPNRWTSPYAITVARVLRP